MNPLLADWSGKYQEPPFDQIKNSDYLPAFNEGIRLGKLDIENIKNNKEEPSFENTILALEDAGQKLNQVAEVFFNLNSAETSEEMQKIAREVSPLLSEYSNDINLDEELFKRVKTVYDHRENLGLNGEDLQLVEKTYKSFSRNGALLKDEVKEEFRKVDARLSELSLIFSERNLNATNEYALFVKDQKDLEGIPAGVIEEASATAKARGHEGEWAFTLHYPSYLPFMKYCKNRELRKELQIAMSTECATEGPNDNREIVKEMAMLRHKRANLLGYDTHSDFVLEERMAHDKKTVWDFLNDLLKKSRPAAERELKELQDFARAEDGITDLQNWDVTYYSEKLKNKKFSINEEELRPYFKLENVRDGAFALAGKLYGLTFKKVNIPVYHPEVEAYEVNDGDRFMGILYTDFFPRPGKRAGAWQTTYRGQWKKNGVDTRPIASIVTNFTRPTATLPALLTFNEVQTLFHEFGHSLHSLLADTTRSSLSGTNVYWDFVELPSQFMENFTYEMDVLALFARHYKTNELIPEELIKKLKATSTFREGTATIRQLAFGILDMSWYSRDPSDIKDVEQFEIEAGKDTDLMPHIKGAIRSVSFGHIFPGGYSSGYYSYKWAEVLDADAFAHFKEMGIFNKEVSTSFRKNVLSQGGTKHPMDLYVAFRGQKPTVDALLRRAGLI